MTDIWENAPVPELLIAKALALTEKIVLATGVTLLPLHHPVDTAHRIAMLDHMARGRFYWGIGTRSFPTDVDLYGLDSSDMMAVRERGKEALDVILGLWAAEDGHFDFKGKYYEVHAPEVQPEMDRRLHYKPYQLPHPPIGVAGVSVKSGTLVRAGERGWIPMSINIVPTRILQSHWEAVLEGAARTGRTPDRTQWRVARNVFVADTTQEARRCVLEGTMARDFEDYFLRLLRKCKMLDMMKTDPEMPDSEVTPEYLLDNLWLVGSPDDVAEKLQRLQEDLGGFGVLLVLGHEWDPKDRWVESMRLLKEEVLPRVNGGEE